MSDFWLFLVIFRDFWQNLAKTGQLQAECGQTGYNWLKLAKMAILAENGHFELKSPFSA